MNEISYKFRLLERALVSGLLPKQADYTTLVIAGDIQDKIKFTQEDMDKYKIVPSGTGLAWGSEYTAEEFEYSFSELEINLIKDKLVELDGQKKLSSQHLNLYRMFITNK